MTDTSYPSSPAAATGGVATPAHLHAAGGHHRPPLSWSAIIAGALVALATAVALSALCTALGIGGVRHARTFHGAAAAAGSASLASVVAVIIALFLGGWTAGHIARRETPTDSTLHGLLVWALAAILGLAGGVVAANGALHSLAEAGALAPSGTALDDAQMASTPENEDAAARALEATAFLFVAGMLLGAAAAAAGGHIGGSTSGGHRMQAHLAPLDGPHPPLAPRHA